MTIFRATDKELENFKVSQELNIDTNAKARTNQRAESVSKFDRYANIVRGLSEDGKQKLSGEPSATELRQAREDRTKNAESRNKTARTKKA